MTTTPDAAGDALVLALTEVIRGATSPEIQQAQAMLLRRLATQGDVIPSRVPAPRNITEVGGYLNLLEWMHEDRMRTDTIGSALGLATESLADLPSTSVPPLRLTAVATQRPDGPAGGGVPLSVAVREDLAGPLVAALADLAGIGGMLPLWGPAAALPAPPAGTSGPPDPMPWLGREVWVAPTVVTTEPETDPVVLGRSAADVTPGYRLGVKVTAGSPGSVTEQWTALAWDAVGRGFVERDLGDVAAVPLETVLAPTTFRCRRVPVAPSGRADHAFARVRSVAGLVPGTSRLGDELALVWSGNDIARSAYASMLDRVWDGTAFAP
ncbi:hypothetical protein [Arthrobacter sp. NEB 688]|uniref:hypothetical protein n=1 Tax=Arthrobacter sp. NEB 688 TaxID=904039 RepID=UPI0015661A8C|nr:hypothetical protein [Arthrobacter sp. NEB 688]QKE84423.1 hypothetical protein HL663_11070 [Arthrobacter sp. NEB 688]